MPQDPNLYGQRPAKKSRQEAGLSSSLDFTAQMTSLMAGGGPPSTTSGRTRSSKEVKDNIFKSSKQKSAPPDDDGSKLQLKEPVGTEDETKELAHAKRKMENKARLYAAMKRGDYVPKENEAAPLIDFDRKWAENVEGKEDYSTSHDSDSDGDDYGGTEIIEFEDEFGRSRKGTKADKEKMERRQRRGLLGAEELERMSARPTAPANLIYGDTVQSLAFNPDDPDKMEELARKRDRSATPPEQKHYDADAEIRTKGVAFYKFSKDEDTRQQEMKNLTEERQMTDQLRQAREDQRAARRHEIEQRRKQMAARRAKRQADNFLEELGGNEQCDKSPLSPENPPQVVKIQSQDINDIHPTPNPPRSAQLLLDLDFCTALNSISSSSSTTANISGQDFPVFTTDSQSPWLPQQSSALPAPSEHNPQLSPDNPHQDFVLFDNPPQNPNRSASSLSNQRRHSYNNRLERSAASHAVQNQRVAQILQSIGHSSYSVNGNRNNNNNTQFYASSAPSSTVALNQQPRSARPPVPLFNQSTGNVHQSARMMNAADVDLDDLPIFDGGASTAFSSPAVRTSFDFNGSMSSSASNLGTVSPQDLLIQEPFMSAPNSAALTALTSPSVYNESPEFGDGYDVSPNFGSADFDGSGDPWYPLFPQDASSAPEQTNLEDSPAQRSDDIDSVGNGSGVNRKKASGSPTSGGRHSSVSGVNARKRDKPLPPIVVDDPHDSIAMKRARNTLAARKSRERKAQRLEDLEEKIAKLEQERDHWKKIALSQSSR